MVCLNISSSFIRIRDLEEKDLEYIYKWYNMTEEFRFATGYNEPVRFEELKNMYTKAILQENVFFAGIHNENDIMIGMINGRIIAGNKSRIWLNIFAIDPAHRRKGYGSIAFNMLVEHFASDKNISEIFLAVERQNNQGKQFWEKQDFEEIKKVKHTRMLMGLCDDITIMRRKLA